MLHPPQLLGSFVVLTQLAPHSVGVAPPQELAQEYTPPLFLQREVAPEHCIPQPPQLAGVERSASQPFAALPSQSA